MDKANIELLRKQAKTAYKGRDYHQAVELYQALNALSPEEVGESAVSDRMGHASALLGLNRNREAVTVLDQAIALAPDDPQLRFKLAEIYSRMMMHEEAANEFAEAGRLSPDDANPFWRLAMELRALGRNTESREALKRCLAIDPNHAAAQLFQLEEATLATPERDGLAFEAENFRPRGTTEHLPPPPNPFDGLVRNPVFVVVQAVALVIGAIWLRSLFS